MKVRSSRCAVACPARNDPMPPVTTGKNAANNPPSDPAKVPRSNNEGDTSIEVLMCCGGTRMPMIKFVSTMGMANRPMKAGSKFTKATDTGAKLRYIRMRPSRQERKNVNKPAANCDQAARKRAQFVGPRSPPLGHSDINMNKL